LTADPHRINPGALEVNPALYTTQAATTVFLQTLRINNSVHQQTTKLIIKQIRRFSSLVHLHNFDFTLA
jgi:hypothetical protein